MTSSCHWEWCWVHSSCSVWQDFVPFYDHRFLHGKGKPYLIPPLMVFFFCSSFISKWFLCSQRHWRLWRSQRTFSSCWGLQKFPGKLEQSSSLRTYCSEAKLYSDSWGWNGKNLGECRQALLESWAEQRDRSVEAEASTASLVLQKARARTHTRKSVEADLIGKAAFNEWHHSENINLGLYDLFMLRNPHTMLSSQWLCLSDGFSFLVKVGRW